MRDSRLNPPVTDTEIDEMAEYYEFAEATGGFKSVRGFKLTPEEETSLSATDKAAKYRKATLDAVGEEHRGKPVRRVHWVYGAPGSGKTARTSLGHLLVPDTSEAAHTNPDDYKRFHSAWNFGEGAAQAHQFSRDQSGRTLQEALEEGMDVVVQGTGKDGLLMNSVLFPGRDHRNGRRSDTASVMHFLHVSDTERARRIFDRGRRDTPTTGQERRDQRKRYGAEPEDAMNVLDQVVKFIEEGRVDEAHIYDNSGPIDETPPLVATFKDGHLVIYDEDKFNEIFDPKDSDGNPVLFRGKVADRPAVTRYSPRDDPRRGKTYAERLREEGENPGGLGKWDEARREKAIRETKRTSGDAASYRGMHTAPSKSKEGGDTLDSLTNMLPLQEGENNNDRIRLYGSSGSDPEYARANDEMLEALDAVAGNPDQTITVYRAASRDGVRIIAGDWVTPSTTYAAIHGEGPMRGDYKIIAREVRAGDLVSEGNSLYEFGWDPKKRPETDGLASRRGDEGENLQNAYRRHLKAKGIQTDGERAFEEQYGYELRSGDGDCYSASYRAAVELAEKGVDADGDPVTNVRVVVGSPVFPKVGERSGHAWVEYDAVKPPPPLMSSADRDHAKEQILVLVEGMDLPPKQKQATIDSFLEAIDRANEANAAAPVRDVTMVRDYASVRDGDDILEFDDMDRGRLEALKPDMARDVYYRAGEMEEVDIAGRFSPAEYEETQVSLFGGDFYDGDATFLTREQVDQHLEDMGIDGGFESKRTDDADAEDERLHNEAIGQLREIFAEAGAEQSDTILDQLAYEMRSSPRGMMGGRDAPIKPDYLEAIRELVEERDPEFMEDLAETLRIRQTTEGYRRLTESGLDSGVGVHNQEASPIRGIFDGHIKDGDPITLYHGGPVDLTGDVDYEVSRNDSGQWGPGIYTTASAFPAIKGWANPWQRNAEGGYDTVDPGHLHTTRWKGENPPQILDVMDPLPDDVLDEVAIPAIKSLLREIKKSSQAERRDNWKIKYLEEELEATLDFIDRKRGEVTGPETLLQIQKYMQEGDVAYGRGELDGFLPSDRLDLIRNQMNAAIKDLGYDVVKSHEVGIREMSRTDYMFLDPDMVEFVEVATTHSLAGFGNMSGGEMGSTVRRRAKATREAAGLRSERGDEDEHNLSYYTDLDSSTADLEGYIPGRDQMEAELLAEADAVADPGGLPSRRNAGPRLRPKEELAALQEGRYHPKIGFPEQRDRPESRQPLWDARGQLTASRLTDVDPVELETYHSLLGKYIEHRRSVRDTYQSLWRKNGMRVSEYPTWVTDRLYHRPLDTPTKTTLAVRYDLPSSVTLDPIAADSVLRHAKRKQAEIVDEFFARHLGEDWRDTNPDTRLTPDGTRGKFGKTAITFGSTGLNYSETLELFEQAELLATHHYTFKKHWQKDFDDLKEHAKTTIAVRQVRRAHRAAGAGEEEFDLGVTLYTPGVDNFRGAVSTDQVAMVNMLEDMLLASGHGPLSESQVELLGNASEIVLLEHQTNIATNTLTMDRVGDKTGSYESLDSLPAEWHRYDEDAVVITIPMQMRQKVKRAGVAYIANHLTPEENDVIDAVFGTPGDGDSEAFKDGNAALLINEIHLNWAATSAGHETTSLTLQQVTARSLGWDDQKIADELFHNIDTSGVIGHEDSLASLAPSNAKGGITYSEIKEQAAKVIQSIGDSVHTPATEQAPVILTAIPRRSRVAPTGLTFREAKNPFGQLDARIGVLLDDLDGGSVADEVRLGMELLGMAAGGATEGLPKNGKKRPRDILFALKEVMPSLAAGYYKEGVTRADAKRVKKAYEQVRAHRAARNNARHMISTLVYEHYLGDAFKAVIAAEQRTTAARLKEMGVETVPLYRGFTLGKDDADALLSALGDTGALYDDHMNPLTAWSTSKQTAKQFGSLHKHNDPNTTGFVVRSDVSVDDIVGLSTHGFGCLSEGECVVGHGERHLTIEQVY